MQVLWTDKNRFANALFQGTTDMVLKQRTLYTTYILYDMVVMGLSFAMAACFHYRVIEGATFHNVLDMRLRFVSILYFGCFIVLWHALLRIFGAYKSSLRVTNLQKTLNLICAIALGTLVLFVSGSLLPVPMLTTPFTLVFTLLVLVLTTGGHFVIGFGFEKIRTHRRMVRHLVIVGTNTRALSLARFFKARPEAGYQFIGFVDDVIFSPELHGVDKFNLDDTTTLLTNFENFPDFIRKHVVDEVILCLPVLSFYKQSADVVALCEDHGITVNYASDLFDLKRDHHRHIEIINVYTGRMHEESNKATFKRAMDVIASALGLLVLLPLFLAVAVLIKLGSKGPVFFKQTRIGKNKRKFTLYKFRTMVQDAEQKMAEVEHLNEMTGPVFKIKNDPRVTRIGKWLRIASIDELPQLFNVLIGDMSLVGPRPMSLRDFLLFKIDWHHRRFSVKPGITCFWQVYGRNTVGFEEWMRLDAHYVDTWSLWTDVKILFKTIPAVLKGSGAA